MSKFARKFLELANFSQNILDAATKLDVKFSKEISISNVNCIALTKKYLDDPDKVECVMNNLKWFFTEHFDNLCKPLIKIDENGSAEPTNDDWVTIGENDKPGESGHRKLVLFINKKYQSICIPFSEIYEVAIKIAEEDSEKEYYIIRLIYHFLSCMATMKCDGYDTEDMLPLVAVLENAAKIPSNDIMENFKGLDLAQNLNNSAIGEMMNNFDAGRVVGMLKNFSGIEEMGPVASIIGQMSKMLVGKEEGNPEEQD